MDTDLITHLNLLWKPVYPYLARWIEPWLPEDTNHILEIGPFSGGIITSLLKRHPTLQGAIALEESGVAKAIQASFRDPCPMLISRLEHLPLLPTFNLVICRGAFFFLTLHIIKECCRILQPGGHALLGGGYGPVTPEEIISPIATESKDLNYRLGKKWLSRKNLAEMVSEAGMEKHSTIIEEGGLWLLISQNP